MKYIINVLLKEGEKNMVDVLVHKNCGGRITIDGDEYVCIACNEAVEKEETCWIKIKGNNKGWASGVKK